MSANSSIEWTTSTWNPVTGCSKVSEGCRNCYAERMAKRLQKMGQPNYRNGFQVTVHEQVLFKPFGWKRPRTVFVNSMSDLFHEQVPGDFIMKVFEVMNHACHHTYQVLTKRPERLVEMDVMLPWTRNIWMGVTVESRDHLRRIDSLRRTKAKFKFLSIEPLLGPIGALDLDGICWVIVGGESGPGARPMKQEWVLSIRDQCVREGVPFFFKQWGGTRKKSAGHLLEGQEWRQIPS